MWKIIIKINFYLGWVENPVPHRLAIGLWLVMGDSTIIMHQESQNSNSNVHSFKHSNHNPIAIQDISMKNSLAWCKEKATPWIPASMDKWMFLNLQSHPLPLSCRRSPNSLITAALNSPPWYARLISSLHSQRESPSLWHQTPKIFVNTWSLCYKFLFLCLALWLQGGACDELQERLV